MRSRARTRNIPRRIWAALVALAVAGLAGFAGLSVTGTATAAPAAAAASAAGPRGWYIDPNGTPHYLPHGTDAVGQNADYGTRGYWFKGFTLDTAAATTTATVTAGTSPVSVLHRTVTVDADYQAGTEAQRTITVTGLPAYSSSGSKEITGDNSAGVPDALAAGITVTEKPPTNGQTTRSFVVAASGFNGTEKYALDVWVLAVTG